MKQAATIMLTAICAFCATGTRAQIVPRATASAQVPNAVKMVNYRLPVTRLQIAVTAERTTYIPGRFSAYADALLQIADAPVTERDKWTITSLTLTPYGVADARTSHALRYVPATASPKVVLADDGRLLAVNDNASALPALIEPRRELIADGQNQASDYATPLMLQAGSEAEAAHAAANEIKRLRRQRTRLAAGEADFPPASNAQLQTMLAELERQEQALLVQFTGTTRKERHVVCVSYTPERGKLDDVAFRFSENGGVLEPTATAGEPCQISLRPQQADTVGNQTVANAALTYCIPAVADVALTLQGKPLLRATVAIAQLGRLSSLPANYFTAHAGSKMSFSPTTGALIKLEQKDTPTAPAARLQQARQGAPAAH